MIDKYEFFEIPPTFALFEIAKKQDNQLSQIVKENRNLIFRFKISFYIKLIN